MFRRTDPFAQPLRVESKQYGSGIRLNYMETLWRLFREHQTAISLCFQVYSPCRRRPLSLHWFFTASGGRSCKKFRRSGARRSIFIVVCS